MIDFVFLLLFFVTVAGAFLAVHLNKVFYNALALGLSFMGLAGIFVFLDAEFLALLQIIINIGAIAIVIVFAIMMNDPNEKSYANTPLKLAGILVMMLFIFGALCQIIVSNDWIIRDAGHHPKLIAEIGLLFLTKYILPFEVISFVLFIAILGALVITKKQGGPS